MVKFIHARRIFLKRHMSLQNNEKYTVTEDVEVLAPHWLIQWIDWGGATILYGIRDGHEIVKGVRINNEVAKIGDTLLYDGKRISIERK